ncbi:zinc transporter 10-like [Triticum urartu]|nr:zinc transporter 10-like [Triticum urartu]
MTTCAALMQWIPCVHGCKLWPESQLSTLNSHPIVLRDKSKTTAFVGRRSSRDQEMEPYVALLPYLQRFAASVSAASCDAEATGDGGGDVCRNEAAALQLKMVAVAAILVSSAAGVAIPLVGHRWRGGVRAGEGGWAFVLAKAFAAGVVLGTGYVHMMHDAEEKFLDPCLPDSSPWRQFPFAGSVAMLASLVTLMVDFIGTQFYERKPRDMAAAASATTSAQDERSPLLEDGRTTGGEKCKATLGHSHAHVYEGVVHNGHGHENEEGPSQARQVVVSQILELGIVSHSVIIGLSLGISQSTCTIKPLVAALSFHQFFEGFALGDCISQAQLKDLSMLLMAFFFAIKTPAGIAAGSAMASFYNPYSPRALVVEGILNAMSAGVLIYMALVDLIAADFLGRRMSNNPTILQVGAYVSLFLGAIAMASLAIWT